MRNGYPFKYGELKVAAETLASMINSTPSITNKHPHIAQYAEMIQNLIREQEER